MIKKRLIVGNWKMYVESPEASLGLLQVIKRRARGLHNTTVWIAPPAVLLGAAAHSAKGSSIEIGTQLVSHFEGGREEGQHTGEISARMIKSTGGSFAIVGHSERRALGDSDDVIARQLLLCAQANLTAILCIGESDRDEHGGHFDFLVQQLRSALADFPINSAGKLVVAYEPLYAIGKTAQDAPEPRSLRETAIFIRKVLTEKFGRLGATKIPVLYGGSVEGANAEELITLGDVNGFLVGRASVESNSLFEIVQACEGKIKVAPHKTAKMKSKSTKSKKKKR